MQWHDTFQYKFPGKDNNWKKRLLIRKLGTKENQKVCRIYFTQMTFGFVFHWDDYYSNGHFRRTTISFQHLLQLLQDSQKPVRLLHLLRQACESWMWEVPSSDTDRRPIQMLNLYSRSPLTRWFRKCFRLLVKLETDEKVTVQDLTAECNRLLKLRKDTMLVQQQSSLFSQPSQVSHIHSNKSKGSNKIPPSTCWSCGEWHYAWFCPFNKHKCQVCHKCGHKENFCRPPNVRSPDHQTQSESAHQTYKKWIRRENPIQCLLLSK